MIRKAYLVFLLLITGVAIVSGQERKMELGIIISPTYTSRYLTGPGDKTDDLNELESGLFSFDAGAQLALINNGRFSLLTGLIYSRKGFNLGEYVHRDNTGMVAGKIEPKVFYSYLEVPIKIHYRLKEGSKTYLIGGITNDLLVHEKSKTSVEGFDEGVFSG